MTTCAWKAVWILLIRITIQYINSTIMQCVIIHSVLNIGLQCILGNLSLRIDAIISIDSH